MKRMSAKTKRGFQIAVCVILIASVVLTTLLLYSSLFSNVAADAADLRQGSTGETVKQVQTKLSEKGYYKGSADGIFGAATTSAVKSFQRDNGLTVDGVVGTQTAEKLGISSNGTGSGNAYLLAKLIYAEARGEPYVGQVAVAAVVLNRVKSSSFPNTMAGVIYQPWAFTCVNDGQINLSPDATSQRAAQDALNGWDPTNGCLYYYNPVTATNQWIRGLEIHLTIGRHVFCL